MEEYKIDDDAMVKKLSRKEFRDCGGLWFVNRVLHLLGMAIVVVIDDDKVIDCYPARVKYRGFGPHSESGGFVKVSKYLKDNIDDLVKEAKE